MIRSLKCSERYRELLQASSAIISISKSSQRVLEAIEECKEAILSQHNLPLPQSTAIPGINGEFSPCKQVIYLKFILDKPLTKLQVLSTHIKLLLDTPEHLWRLIERKKYLDAGWLFLLSRVTYRALITHDEDDSWAEEGLKVEVSQSQSSQIATQWRCSP